MEEDVLIQKYKAVVIGGSAGSLDVLFKLLPMLRIDIAFSIIIVLHRRNSGDSTLTDLLSTKTKIPISEVEDKDQIFPNKIYLAPADYHLLIEKNGTFSLDYSEKINFSRPSLDVSFESAADVFGSELLGIILSGANEDGTKGLQTVKRAGGTVLAQDPSTAQMPVMPLYAIDHCEVDFVFGIEEMAAFLNGGK